MLVLKRKTGESIVLEIPIIDPIKITLFEDGKIGVEAPDEVEIVRSELLNGGV